LIRLLHAAHTLTDGAVSLSANGTGVQSGGELTFTASADEADPVVQVTFSYRGPGIGGEPAAIEIRHDLLSLEPGKDELLAGTICHQKASLPWGGGPL
jgi:hypothetical protein